MPSRSKESVVAFARPFTLTAIGRELPAGEYRISVDEDEILGLSFLAYQRVATILHVPAIGARGPQQSFEVEADELAAALERE